jgi:hypothetical protein
VPSIAGILEDSSQIERRIKMIAKTKKSSPMQWAAAVLIFAALAGVGLTDAYPAPPPFEFGPATNLGPVINTSIQEFPWWVTPDGLQIWFQRSTSNWETNEGFMATRATKDDPWGTPVSVGLGNDPSTFKAIGAVPGITTADGLEMYFSDVRTGGYGSSDIWVAKRTAIGANWSQLMNLGQVVNSWAGEAYPTISLDGLELYFDSGSSGFPVRPGGYGRADLWVTKRATRNTPWGTPVNLGPTVNSDSADGYPVLLNDGRLLFFFSDRPGGYGSCDLWVTTRATTDSPWKEPVNLGPSVNSAGMEIYAYMSADGSTLIFNSNRPGGYGLHDIWQAPILAGPACGDSEHPYPAVDLNKDCRVDLADLAVLLAHWLECTAPECD